MLEKQKKRNRFITLAVCLMMLVTLVAPVDTAIIHAAVPELQNPRTGADGNVTWDCVYFGHYPQSSDGNGGFKNEPIKWRVLSVNGNDAFLLADKNIDGGIPYNETYSNVTWENCTMRSWLNGYGSNVNRGRKDYTENNFVKRAFNAAEQNAILEKTVEAANNPIYGTYGGKNTKDKIFLLSLDEMKSAAYGFSSDPDEYSPSRESVNTAYTASKNKYMSDKGNTGWSWIRLPGNDQKASMFIYNFGFVTQIGHYVNSPNACVRPALHLDLSSDFWSYAGTVSSKIRADEEKFPTDMIIGTLQEVDKQGFSVRIDGTNYPTSGGFDLGKAYNICTTFENKRVEAYVQKGEVIRMNSLQGDGNGTPVDSATESLSYGGHTYKIYDLGNNSYNVAKQFCKKQGGYLATISSKEENDILYDYVKKSGYTDAYFGLMRTEENKWVWVNGEESTYRNWAGGESNNTNGNEDYGMFYWKFTNGQWNDGGFGNGCTDRDTTRFICEWDKTGDSIASSKNLDIIKAVERYTSDVQLNQLTEIMQSNWSDERKFKAINDLFHTIGILDPQEGIEYLGQTTDERFAYRGLMTNEMYCADNFIRWLFSDEGFPARAAYYSSALLLNQEWKEWINIEDVLLAETPGVKKYKVMLLSFLKKQNDAAGKDSYLQTANKVIKGISKATGSVADESLFKELNSSESIDDMNQIISKYWKSISKNGKPIQFEVADSAFKDSLGAVGKSLGFVASGIDEITYYLELTYNFETYSKYEWFFNEIIQASDDEIPRELRIAATFLQRDFKSKEEQVAMSIMKQIGSSEVGKVVDLGLLSENCPISGALDTISLGAVISNLLIDAGGMVKNISYTEAYVYLTNFYTQKLEECKQQFLQNKTEENAWKFYNTYNLLYQLRKAGEESYLNIYNMKGLCGALVKNWNGFSEKEEVVTSNLELLQKSLRFEIDKKVPVKDDRLYNDKIVVACPVDVQIYNDQGKLVHTIYDGQASNEENSEGRFIAMYRPSTDDYIKVAYLNQEKPFRVKLIGKDAGTVSMTVSSKAKDSAYKFYNLPVDKGDQITVENCGTTSPSYKVNYKDGKKSVQGDLIEAGNNEVAVTGINLDSGEKVLRLGESRFLKASVFPRNASCQEIQWSSDQPEIISVKDGIITGKSKGTATITATTLDGGYEDACKFTVTEDAISLEPTDSPTKPMDPANPADPPTIPTDPTDSEDVNQPSGSMDKSSQTITAKSVTKTYGSKSFRLNAKAKGKLTYKSSNTKVAAVSAVGTVTIKGTGKATITITAAATSNYKAATKKITITVNPKKAALTKVSSPKARTLKATWKKDTKASGYQVVIAQNSKFTKGKKTAAVTKNSTTSKTFSKLKKRATYYVKVRAYKTSGKTKLYGAYSSVKKVKIK